MRCPNVDCPYLLKHHAPASYRADIERCSDCQTLLVSNDVELPATSMLVQSRMDRARRGLSRQTLFALLVTVVGLAFLPVTEQVWLPYFDAATFAGHDMFGHAGMSIVALGVSPWLSSSMLVELAALIVPRWRHLRHGGPAARATLTKASNVLGVAFAFLQAGMLIMWFQGLTGMDALVDLTSPLTRGVLLCTLVAGACVCRAAVDVVARFGIGNGFVVLTFSTGAFELVRRGHEMFTAAQLSGSLAPQQLTVLVASVAVAVATWALVRGRDDDDDDFVPTPSAGVVPAVIGTTIAANLLLLGLDLGHHVILVQSGIAGVIMALTFPLFVLCFSSSTRAATVRARLAGRAAPGAADLDSAHAGSRRALPPTIGLLVVFVVAWCLGAPSLAIVLLVVVSKDVLFELQARRLRSDLVAVWPLHRFDLVAPVLAALRAEGIAADLRGAHYRAVFHFFAPYAPVEILVDRADADRAVVVIDAVNVRALAAA